MPIFSSPSSSGSPAAPQLAATTLKSTPRSLRLPPPVFYGARALPRDLSSLVKVYVPPPARGGGRRLFRGPTIDVALAAMPFEALVRQRTPSPMFTASGMDDEAVFISDGASEAGEPWLGSDADSDSGRATPAPSPLSPTFTFPGSTHFPGGAHLTPHMHPRSYSASASASQAGESGGAHLHPRSFSLSDTLQPQRPRTVSSSSSSLSSSSRRSSAPTLTDLPIDPLDAAAAYAMQMHIRQRAPLPPAPAYDPQRPRT